MEVERWIRGCDGAFAAPEESALLTPPSHGKQLWGVGGCPGPPLRTAEEQGSCLRMMTVSSSGQGRSGLAVMARVRRHVIETAWLWYEVAE